MSGFVASALRKLKSTAQPRGDLVARRQSTAICLHEHEHEFSMCISGEPERLFTTDEMGEDLGDAIERL